MHFEEDEAPLATDAEAMQEYARNVGRDHPHTAWLLTSYDVWVKNPYYVGLPVPHPESAHLQNGLSDD